MPVPDGDRPPEDIDEFRNALARRIEALVERHNAAIPARYEAAWEDFAAAGGPAADNVSQAAATAPASACPIVHSEDAATA